MIRHHKVVAALPDPLVADSIYYVRSGSGFDIYVTNSLGTVVAYPINQSGGSGQASFAAVTLTATSAGQTVFPVAGGYASGLLLLSRGGALLAPSEYTATNGTSITLGTAAAVGETMTAYVFKSFAIADAQPISAFLTAIAALTPAANRLLYLNDSGAPALSALTADARNLLTGDLAAMKTTLGVPASGGATPKVGDVIFTASTPPDANYLPLLGGLYNQADYPALFALVGLQGTSPGTVWSIVASGVAANLLGVATDGNGIFIACGVGGVLRRSTDRGATWATATNANTATLNAIRCDGGSVWVAVGVGGVILRSTDKGVTWAAVTNPSTSDLIAVATDRAGMFIAVGANGSTSAKSTDNGATWAVHNVGVTTSLSCIGTDETGVWVAAGASGVVRRTEDNGATWATVTTPAGTAATFYSVAAGLNEVWILTSSNGAYTERSTDSGLTWLASTTGVAAAFNGLATDRNGLWVTMGANGYTRRSSNDGLGWSAGPNTTPQVVNCIALDPTGVFVAAANAGVTVRSVPRISYNSATQFRVPRQSAAPGLTAYIKAK